MVPHDEVLGPRKGRDAFDEFLSGLETHVPEPADGILAGHYLDVVGEHHVVVFLHRGKWPRFVRRAIGSRHRECFRHGAVVKVGIGEKVDHRDSADWRFKAARKERFPVTRTP